MNEHAKKIYQAAIDGKTVQFNFVSDRWRNDHPFNHASSPLICPELWRIKPKTKTLFYRVYLCRLSHLPNIFVDDGTLTAREFEELDSFGGWLSPLRAHEFEEE